MSDKYPQTGLELAPKEFCRKRPEKSGRPGWGGSGGLLRRLWFEPGEWVREGEGLRRAQRSGGGWEEAEESRHERSGLEAPAASSWKSPDPNLSSEQQTVRWATCTEKSI